VLFGTPRSKISEEAEAVTELLKWEAAAAAEVDLLKWAAAAAAELLKWAASVPQSVALLIR
jgi:hypothetical protein